MVKKTGFVPYTIKLWRDSSAGSTMLLAHRYHLHGLKKIESHYHTNGTTNGSVLNVMWVCSFIKITYT